jgi:hypothetical protein
MTISRISGPVGTQYVITGARRTKSSEKTYIELPALEVLAGIFAGYDHHQFRDLSSDHPLVQLPHDFLNVRLHLVVRGDQHSEAIFLDSACSFVSLYLRRRWGWVFAYAVKSSAG